MSGLPRRADGRIPVCYLAPWVDYGGSDKGTIDWLRWLDRDRFAPILVTTQPSANRRLHQSYRYAEEVWELPQFLGGQHFPSCIFDILHTRGVRVLHIMNSRLGYDLLPDLASLPFPPVVVVQLHVEEPDRSGYVRYVTTRYGNLVDAFSVSSEHLARGVEAYDIATSKIRVIPTGVDTEYEFNPSRVLPVEAVGPGVTNILFAGRLTEQKNPLLMVRAVERLVKHRPQVHVHVVGDGPLEADVHELIADADLTRHFSFHPPSRELARWYAACDLLLMTSVFEGVPYVLYEAMAMELPIVAPALIGNVELMGETGGLLVNPDGDADAYAAALQTLIDDRAGASLLAVAGRRRVLDGLDVGSMGRLHGELYDELLAREAMRPPSPADDGEELTAAAHRPAARLGYESRRPLRFTRPMRGQPPVSVVIPCFNHGRFLPGCVASILDQEYESLEVIVVDDASTDGATLSAFEELETQPRVQVLRLPHNSGPSVARNSGIRHAGGRYILPVDSDNLLLPGAVSSLVAQLQTAGERVGYVYPNCQYFGTRDDYFEPPSFNLALLLGGNYCDTCSLIDRDVFDAGIFYPEDIGLGHEDWDFALTLAEHGVRGEPARTPTLLYRKHGFTRSDAVEYASHSFREEVVVRHPGLFGRRDGPGRFGTWSGPAAEIKAADAPGLSIVITVPIDFTSEGGASLLRRIEAQSSRDLEVIVQCPQPPGSPHDRLIRRIPPGLCEDRLELLREGLRLVRAERVLLADDNLVEMLADASFIEKLQRSFWALPTLDAIAFARAGRESRFPFRLLTSAEIDGPADALAWSIDAERKMTLPLLLDEGMLAESIARAMSLRGVALQWRQGAACPSGAGIPSGIQGWVDLADREADPDAHSVVERKMRSSLEPALPAVGWDQVRRWLGSDSWIPPETQLLTRHREAATDRRIVKLGRESPPGYALEYDLGAIQRFAPPGTVRLVRDAQGFRTVPRGSPRAAEEEELGHLELAPLPLLQAVERAILADGTDTLVSGERDVLRQTATGLEFLGFIEAFPNQPTSPPDARRERHGIVSLVRCLNREARRHTYRAGTTGVEGDTLVGELGALHLTAEWGSIAVMIDEHGRLTTTQYSPEVDEPALRELLRWSAAPIGWRGFGHLRGRVRAIARRGLESVARTNDWPGPEAWTTSSKSIVGYLYSESAPGRLELFAAVHRVTGDQLLTHYALEAADMGYGAAVSLGYVLEQAPLTGTLATARVSVPWASRFGLEVRRS